LTSTPTFAAMMLSNADWKSTICAKFALSPTLYVVTGERYVSIRVMTRG
jgi:hypothetical protein